jgi:hypothetical protein
MHFKDADEGVQLETPLLPDADHERNDTTHPIWTAAYQVAKEAYELSSGVDHLYRQKHKQC